MSPSPGASPGSILSGVARFRHTLSPRRGPRRDNDAMSAARRKADPEARARLPELLAARCYRSYTLAVIAARKANSASYSVAALAAAAGVDPGRLLKALRGDLHLMEDEAARLAPRVCTSPSQHPFFVLLVRYNQEEDLNEKRRLLDELVALLEARAERAGRGATFRLRNWWTHLVGGLLLVARAAPPLAEALAARLGCTVEQAELVLSDVAKVGGVRKLRLQASLTAGPEADLATVRLVDDMLLLGLRALREHPGDGMYRLAHWALPLAALDERAGDLSAVHELSGGEGADPGPLVPWILVTHSTLATDDVEAGADR